MARALFVIERLFAEQLQLDAEGVAAVEAYNNDANLRWLFSFLSVDRKKTYCLYEARDAEALKKQAEDLGLPGAVIEVTTQSGDVHDGRLDQRPSDDFLTSSSAQPKGRRRQRPTTPGSW